MGNITKNYIYNAAYQLLVLLTPIVTAPYLSRVLGAENLGIYSYINSSGIIVVTIFLLGIYAYGNRQIAYVRDKRLEVTKTFWELEFSRLILLILGSIAYFLYLQFNGEYKIYFILYYPYVISQFIDCSWVYVGMEDMKPAVIKNFIARLANVVGIFIFVRDRGDLGKYIFIYAMTTLIANASIYLQLHKYIDKPNAQVKKIFYHIKNSTVLFLPQAATLLYLQVDKVMLQWLTGRSEQVSYYDQAEKIINIPLALITVLSTVVMPRIANEFKKKNLHVIEKLINRVCNYALFMACPMMVGLFAIARQFVPWYLGNEFLSTAYLMMILSPLVVLNSLTGISGEQFFTATNQIGILFRSYISAAVVNICINAVLIPKIGCYGSAIATVFSSLISVIIQYNFLFKQIHIKELKVAGIKYGIGAVLMGGILFLLTGKLSASINTTVIQIVIGGICYIVYLLLIKDSTLKEIFKFLKGK